MRRRAYRVLEGVALAFALAAAPPGAAGAETPEGFVRGVVRGEDGAPLEGAQVTLFRGDPRRRTTVFTDAGGRFRTPPLAAADDWGVRVRRIGWRDLRREGAVAVPQGGAAALELTLARHTDPAEVAAQLPANRWLALLLEEIEEPDRREEFVRQCTYCHQQGSRATRIAREDWQWEKILALMARMGGTLSPELRERVPELFRTAYAPERAVPRLTRGFGEPGFAPPPPPRVRRAVIDEWELGGRASMQHDLTVHPDGRVYSVDMMQDALYRLDPATGAQEAFPVPREGLELGGVFGNGGQPLPPTANAYQGPHSIQVAPDGALWTTLALGNRLGRFDPQTERWTTHPLPEGLYPHTLRFDPQGRIWFSVAVSNHLGMLDPATGAFRTVRLPAGSFGQAVTLRLLPALLWLNRRFDLSGMAAEGGGGDLLPVPYGVDVAPDGGVWFSQLNQHRIGRLDPESFEVEVIETPFTAPRRLRFDAQGRLWIPGFSSGVVSRFDPKTREFRTWELPIEPAGTETPYALHVDRRRDHVWICGTNSDTLIRFEPGIERFTVYPLPTRVTYTREIDFDARGRVWTSNSNLPTWQVEGGFPRVLRLDPEGLPPAPAPAASRSGLDRAEPDAGGSS